MKSILFIIVIFLLQIVQISGQSALSNEYRNISRHEGFAHFINRIEKTDVDSQAAESPGNVIEPKVDESKTLGLIFELKVANDMTFFTDHYFSSGIALKVFAPFMTRSPFSKIMLPHGKDVLNYYALTFTHNLYTPIYIDTLSFRSVDHPFAAYFLFGNRKESFNLAKRYKLTSALQLGLIGPIAGGHVFQNTLHEYISIAKPVAGWEDQISNDLCLQYSATFEKGIIDLNNFELNANAGGRLGIPHAEAQLGVNFRLGHFDDYFKHIGICKDGSWQVWLFCAGDANFIAYNAVLQGGIFNRGEPNTLQTINHLLWHTRFGGTLVYKNIKFEIAQEVVSPSFESALWHRWAYVGLMLGF